MTASLSDRWLPSSKRNPCPVCGRTKDGDCRIRADGQEVICHHPKDLKPGEVLNGWAFTGNTSDGRAGHFTIDKPRTGAPARAPRKVVPIRSTARPAPLPPGPLQLARLPQPITNTSSPYGYSATQRVHRIDTADGKRFRCEHHDGQQWCSGSGPDPWPAWHEQQALAATGWVVELEGERCAGIALAGGAVAITQPGHAHGIDQIRPRYARLQAAGVAGVVFIADHDQTGEQRAQQAAEAAAAAGLPLLILPAVQIWPDLPHGGSIDDAPGTPADRIAAVEAAAAALLQQQQQPSPPTTLEELLGPVEDGKLHRPRNDLLTQALALVMPLKYNLLSNRIEHQGQPIHGDFLDGLYLELAEQHRVEVAKQRAVDAAMRVARQNAYHPVRDYLNSLSGSLEPTEWAAIDVLCFGQEDPHGWSGLHLQRQLIGLVARALDPGCELHTCLVLQSDDQGIGKSTFWKLLGGEWFSDSLGDLRDLREDRLQLHSAWIHEWGEIDNVMGKRESETLKRFLSCSRDDVRRPYGRGTEQFLRSCGIVGTTNRRDFIKDPTGNRRFPIIQVQAINLQWVAENRDRIWGSALQAYRAGQPWHYSGQENQILSEQARAFAADDPLRDCLEAWADDHPDANNLPLQRILWDLQHSCPAYWEKRRDKEFMRQVGLALTAIGWKPVKDQRIRFLMPDGSRTDKVTIWQRP